jgi:hypothetical protein
MFEVGSKYEFRIIEGGDETMFWGTIETYEHPMIKLRDEEISVVYAQQSGPGSISVGPTIVPGKIMNVTSPNFISAVKRD